MAAAPLPIPRTTPENAPLSQGARIVDTFFAPTKTFTDLRRSASWWAPFLLTVIVSVIFVAVVDQKVGFRKVTENQIQMSPKATARLDQMPAAERSQAMARQAKVTRYISYGFWLLLLIWNVIVAAILLGTFKLGAGADLTFKTSLAVVMYASLPLLLKSILAIVSLLAGVSTDSFTFQNPVATNPGYFLTPADSPFLYSLATSLDIFMIWTLILTAIGFSTVSKVKRSTALAGVFGWYVLFMLVSAGFGALFS
jgi:hypothetical protein